MNDKARRIIASVISFFIYLAGSVLLLSSLYSDNGKFFLTVVCSLPLACILYCGIYSYVLTAKSGETVHPAQIMCVFILPYAVLGILFFITSLIIDEEYNFDIMFYLIFFVNSLVFDD